MDNKPTYLIVKDHSVSGEEFQLNRNSKYGFLETCPQPSSEELPKYYESEDYISHTDSKRNLFEKAYHIVRSVALKQKLKIINRYSGDDKTLLDVGCGTGDFLEVAQNNNWNVTGIEPNSKARQIANSKTNNSAFEIEYLKSLKEHSFDVITLWHVLEHLPNLEMHIELFNHLLKPNGTLIIAVPNYNSLDASFYQEFWAAYDVPRHLWHFSQNSMKRLFSNFNMKVIKIVPMKFDAYYVSLLSEKYKTGRMNYLRAFVKGLQSNIKARCSGEYSSLIYILKRS